MLMYYIFKTEQPLKISLENIHKNTIYLPNFIDIKLNFLKIQA